MVIAPYKFASNTMPINFNLSQKRDIDDFTMYVGRIKGAPTAIIELPKRAFNYHREDGRPSDKNSTRYDIKWMIKEHFDVSVDFSKEEDVLYVGWTNSPEPAGISILPTLIKQSQFLYEPNLIWEWIKHVCSSNSKQQQQGGIRFEYSAWRKSISLDRINFG